MDRSDVYEGQLVVVSDEYSAEVTGVEKREGFCDHALVVLRIEPHDYEGVIDVKVKILGNDRVSGWLCSAGLSPVNLIKPPADIVKRVDAKLNEVLNSFLSEF